MRSIFNLAIAVGLGFFWGRNYQKKRERPVIIEILERLQDGTIQTVGYIQTDGFNTTTVALIEEATVLSYELAQDLINILDGAMEQNQFLNIVEQATNQLQLQ